MQIKIFVAIAGASLALTAAANAQPPVPASPAEAARRAPRPQPPTPNWGKMRYDALGPNKVVSEAGGDTCTVWRPESLGQDGAKHPIVLWGNGTGLRPTGYAQTLENLASWGFVVAAANTTNAGTGVDMLNCLKWLEDENGRAGSLYQGKLDTSKVGASGHSQGGGGTLMAGRDPRIKATAPVQPYTRGLGYVAGAQGQQHGPILLLSGGADTIAGPAANQQIVFDEAKQPIIWATLKDSSHMAPMGGGGVYPGIITGWFRYHLMGDREAAALFEGPTCGYCTSPDWTIQRKNGA